MATERAGAVLSGAMPKYQTLELLGQGAMGVVYRALDPSLNREVALKVLRKRGDEKSSEVIARFRREMTALVTLSHPNIVKIFDVDEVDGQLCYAMELLTANSLGQLVKENGAFPSELVVPILDQLLDALDHIHEKHLVHRDIKPANIMLEESGRTVLMDFGLVGGARRPGSQCVTGAGVVIGTPRYLAPEVLRGKEADRRSDLYSLGVVAYELLAGEHPFEACGTNVSQLLAAIMNTEPDPLRERRPDLPQGLLTWVERSMQKAPELRYADAKEARQALKDVDQQLAYAQAVEAGMSSLTVTRRSLAGMRRSLTRIARPARSRGRGKLVAYAVGVALAAAAVGGLVALAVLTFWPG